MKSAECKPNCQPVTLSFTVKLPYGQLVAQWKGLRQRYLWWDDLEPISRPRVRAELKRLNPRWRWWWWRKGKSALRSVVQVSSEMTVSRFDPKYLWWGRCKEINCALRLQLLFLIFSLRQLTHIYEGSVSEHEKLQCSHHAVSTYNQHMAPLASFIFLILFFTPFLDYFTANPRHRISS